MANARARSSSISNLKREINEGFKEMQLILSNLSDEVAELAMFSATTPVPRLIKKMSDNKCMHEVKGHHQIKSNAYKCRCVCYACQCMNDCWRIHI